MGIIFQDIFGIFFIENKLVVKEDKQEPILGYKLFPNLLNIFVKSTLSIFCLESQQWLKTFNMWFLKTSWDISILFDRFSLSLKILLDLLKADQVIKVQVNISILRLWKK